MPDTDIFARARKLIEPGESCIDIGCGTKPQSFARYRQHICIEPCHTSVYWLERRGFNVKPIRAQDVLPDLEPAFAVYLLDVLHTMELPDAMAVLELAKKKSMFQVIVSSPPPIMNRHEQPEHLWDRHRSVWTPDMLGPESWQHMVDGDRFISVLTRPLP
jgi:hypothetical protein